MGNELPQEVLIEIFSRLPAKSVGKCRCLAKPWRTLLSTPQFIESHLSRRPHEETLILITKFASICTISKKGCGHVSEKLDLQDSWVEVVGSCDGLVVLSNEDEDLFLMNPTTVVQVKIPNSPLALEKSESFRVHGFGYDSHSEDYKIVTLSYYDDSEYEVDCADTFVDVYSVKRGVWKRVDCSPYDHGIGQLSSGAFVNGTIHWLASNKVSGCPTVIAAFDLASEVFSKMPSPNGVDMNVPVSNKLVVLGGYLCMVNTRHNKPMDFWIMKEYGLADSWMRFTFNVELDLWYIMKPLCFSGDDDDGDVVFVTDGKALVVYNFEEGMLRDMVIDGDRVVPVDGSTFVESLVSPSFGLADKDV